MKRCQQYELYAAERGVDHGARFGSLDEIGRWVNQLRDEWWWQRFFRGVDVIEVTDTVDLTASVGGLHDGGRTAVLNMLRVHWNEHDVLHELAHPLSESRFDSTSHDPFFARTLLDLTFLVRGYDAWDELQDVFRHANIEVDVTDEAAAHRNRMLGL